MKTSLRLVLPIQGKEVRIEPLSLHDVREMLVNPLGYTLHCVLCPNVGTATAMWNIDRRNEYVHGALLPICDTCADEVELEGVSVHKLLITLDRMSRRVHAQRREIRRNGHAHVQAMQLHR